MEVFRNNVVGDWRFLTSGREGYVLVESFNDRSKEFAASSEHGIQYTDAMTRL
jgi:hypothetical protein